MKSFCFTLVIFLTVAARKCNTPREDKIPVCIQQKIDQIQKEPVWSPPAQVRLYEFQGKKVYLFSSDCCDQFNTLVDEQCNYICAPSGGITGKGDRKCEDFAATAKEIKLVWKDPRGK